MIILVTLLWSSCQPAIADTDDVIKNSVAAYSQGRVLDAIQTLREAVKVAKSAQEKWNIVNLEMDICTHAYQYDCIVADFQTFSDVAKELNNPKLTAAKIVYVVAFQWYLAGNIQAIEKNIGLDFAVKDANPIADPVLATRLFILNAKVLQAGGNFEAAQEYIHRAFSSFLRIDYDKARFEIASLLTELIATEGDNHDIATASRWADIVNPLIRTSLPANGFDFDYYLMMSANLYSYGSDYKTNLVILADAITRTSKLQINPVFRDALLSNITIEKAAILALQGDVHAAHEEMITNPIHARRDQIIKAGVFSSYPEMFYATAETFFDVLDGVEPDNQWKALFDKLPEWKLSVDTLSNASTYKKVVQALLQVKTNQPEAHKEIIEAARERIAVFERGLINRQAFPLPSLIDRIVFGMSLIASSKDPGVQDGNLLVESMELLNRNSRYAISDSLAAIAAQSNNDEQHVMHSILRVSDQRLAWQVEKLRDLVNRITNREPFNPKIWTAQFTAVEFDHDIQRLKSHVRPSRVGLPTLSDLQSVLSGSEVFIGYDIGAFAITRVCVRHNGIWTSPVATDVIQYQQDVKVLTAALTAQYAPSEDLDIQYPVEAAIRLQNVLFDGLSDCMKGAKHLIFLSPTDMAGIPLAALLREKPPVLGNGYDLSKAHWLIYDYAISNVSSVQNFISSRALARRPSGDLQFLGIGDPHLNNRLPDGQIGGEEIAHRSVPVNAQNLSALSELPATREEVTQIAAQFKGNAKILLGDNATEERFLTLQLERYQIIHFATHGLIRGDIPGLNEAALVLTPVDMNDTVNDGLLTATEIANLNLRARLVVLSACNSANFDTLTFGTQVQGLATAFATAGVPTTIASLWPVESGSSMRIMVQFYRQLLGPKSPSVAAAMQLSLINTLKSVPSRAYYHPRFWAPFIVMGDGAARLTHSVVQSRTESTVTIRDDGGEINGAAVIGGGFMTSEIGPSYNGRHSSLLTMHDKDGHTLWSKEDREIAAGRIARFGDINYIAGFVWRGKSIPVLRAVNDSGFQLWKIELSSSFDSASIAAITAGPSGAFMVIDSLGVIDKKFDFDVIHVSPTGAVLGRTSISSPQIQPNASSTYAAAISNGDLFVAANIPTELDPQNLSRNDFGMLSFCSTHTAAHLYRLNVENLAVKVDASVPDTNIVTLSPVEGGLIYAGAEHTECDIQSETAVFGRIGSNLKVQRIWKDDSSFYGQVISIEKQSAGYFAVASIRESVSVQEAKADESGMISLVPPGPPKKHPDYQNAALNEALFITFDERGLVVRKDFVGNGLPIFVDGMFKLGSQYVAYGSDGFNPWITYYH